MPANRLEVLKNMLAHDPSNAFARYGLAMEYVSSGALDQAAPEFEALLAAHPGYLAGYFHYGQTLEKLGRQADARSVYLRGIEACASKGDAHTQSEIEAALALLG
jgi:tetratricopeptide (TPR) repeat protein